MARFSWQQRLLLYCGSSIFGGLVVIFTSLEKVEKSMEWAHPLLKCLTLEMSHHYPPIWTPPELSQPVTPNAGRLEKASQLGLTASQLGLTTTSHTVFTYLMTVVLSDRAYVNDKFGYEHLNILFLIY